jgi:hypothetical protein
VVVLSQKIIRQEPNLRTTSTTKNPTRATKTRREGEPEKSIATPLNSSFLKQIYNSTVAIYTGKTDEYSAGFSTLDLATLNPLPHFNHTIQR